MFPENQFYICVLSLVRVQVTLFLYFSNPRRRLLRETSKTKPGAHFLCFAANSNTLFFFFNRLILSLFQTQTQKSIAFTHARTHTHTTITHNNIICNLCNSGNLSYQVTRFMSKIYLTILSKTMPSIFLVFLFDNFPTTKKYC